MTFHPSQIGKRHWEDRTAEDSATGGASGTEHSTNIGGETVTTDGEADPEDPSGAGIGEPVPRSGLDALIGDDDCNEQEYQSSINAWLERACTQALAADSTSPDLSAADFTPDEELAATRSRVPSFPPPRRPNRPPETCSDLKTMRELALSITRGALGKHSIEGLAEKAKAKLCLALITITTVFVMGHIAAENYLVVVLFTLLGLAIAARWTFQYFSLTRELCEEFKSSVARQNAVETPVQEGSSP